ncbi:hypothetical protein [Citricoccus sp. I39-566]|uniref:hypothetical protein n=1 Tax=Citricoccus sp. I39-566 TaxID=3073268 RepID=UPI00286A6C17|nr:hypothetical protein [Citricoccus sp. I39-566]WMY80061.1 hypothetical protein RE421_16735 [Citricoccus sp. I39-566]
MERLRAEAQGAFDALHLPPRLTLEALIAHVEAVRGRRMKIIETSKLAGKAICGLWVPREDVDVVYHSVTRGRLHRQQMVLHEIAHMILRHDEAKEATWQGISVFREISGEVVQRALARGDFRCDLEVTAEYLADLLAAAIRDSAREEICGYGALFE